MKTVRHKALLAQLAEASTQTTSRGVALAGNTNKPESHPPGNMAPLNLIDTIGEQARYQYCQLCMALRGTVPTTHVRLTQLLHNLVSVAQGARDYPPALHEAAVASGQWVRKARVMLGYDKPQTLLKDVVCGNCGGALTVAVDASTDVRCIGTPATSSCGQVYPQWQWLDLLRGAP